MLKIQKDLLVLEAKNHTELMVKQLLEEYGRQVKQSETNSYDDFNGIDLKVFNPKTGEYTYIDVKCSKPQNQNSENFLMTIQSNKGKYYTEKNTDWYAFINIPRHEVVFISKDNIIPLVNECTKLYGNGRYVLIKKNKIREKGYSIINPNIIK